MADNRNGDRVSNLQKRKWSDGTKKRYDSTNEHMRGWLEVNDPTALNEGKQIIVPMQWRAVSNYFESVISSREEGDKRETYNSFRARKCALYKLHVDARVEVDMSLDMEMELFLAGVTKLSQPHARYIFQQPGGDQYSGRIVAGFDVNDDSFGTLPAHFKDDEYLPLIDLVFPHQNKLPLNFRGVLHYVLACGVYHAKYLIETIPIDHALRQHAFFTRNVYGRLKDSVVTGSLKYSFTGMKATGVPPHTLVLDDDFQRER